ncbi:PstA family ABC transporter permease [Nocardioides marmorisolisilvae]|uniref:ABC transporter permease subunit n=1 Tax=Nocardioides marmorisolisilvae TaxID=1542737 RepID=A0A3N0DWJ0_9ACTN|nr:ABC transporter permease subunit [Nocardioides marmorisolisilvae]RNL79982.1 ABC transporter permease subunit [Nocardioides marmorisolisilvae]
MTTATPDPEYIGSTVIPTAHLTPRTHEPERVRFSAPMHERLALPGAIIAAIAFGLLVGPVLGLIGGGWVPITSFLWMLVTYAVLTGLTEDFQAVKDRFSGVMISSAGFVVVGILALVIGFVLFQAAKILGSIRFSFLTTDMGLTGPLSPLTQGGVKHAIVGTLEQIGIALAISIPLGISTALFLNEIGGKYARLVRTVVEAMTALPSVVAGLFIYASVILLFTKQFNGFAAALAITVLMLPIMIRSADVVLRLVPGNLREAGLALGAGQWSTVRRVVLPTVRSGLTTAIILGTAHGIGETAPVLLTSGVTNNLNFNPFNGPQISLPLAALEFIKSPQPDMRTRGYATAALLLLLVLILFVIARAIGGQQAGVLSDRQLRGRADKSVRDLSRIENNHAYIKAQLEERRRFHNPTEGAPR